MWVQRRIRHEDPANLLQMFRTVEAIWSPEILEAARRQLGVADGVLNVLVAEVGLQGAGVMAFVRQCVSRRMAQHVRVNAELKPGLHAEPRDHLSKPCRCKRRAAFDW